MNGEFVSVILNVFTKAQRIRPYPISAVSPNGKEAIGINFARLRITHTAGLTGTGQSPGTRNGWEGHGVFNHTLFSRDGSKVFWLEM